MFTLIQISDNLKYIFSHHCAPEYTPSNASQILFIPLTTVLFAAVTKDKDLFYPNLNSSFFSK